MFSHEFTLHLGSPLRCRGFPSVVDPWLPNKNSSSLFWKQSLNFLRGTLPPRVLRVWAEPTPVVVLRTPLGRGEYPSHREWLTDDRKRPIRAPDHLSRSLAENPGKGQVLLLVGMQSTQNVSVRLPRPGGLLAGAGRVVGIWLPPCPNAVLSLNFLGFICCCCFA